MVITRKINISTRGGGHTLDITDRVQGVLDEARLANGVVTLFAVGSTVGLTTMSTSREQWQTWVAPLRKSHHVVESISITSGGMMTTATAT
ncbi:MAG TPA: hypothetical protein VJ183_10915 [Chloroflexia bacterium]|nr:hypothetical protein [Chloroflexia bacterium]